MVQRTRNTPEMSSLDDLRTADQDTAAAQRPSGKHLVKSLEERFLESDFEAVLHAPPHANDV